MLLLFLLVHMLSKSSTLAERHSLDSRASVDSCDDINSCRRPFDIVWGCLTTIFACTWVSVHPNVPPPDQSRLALFWRRLKLMLIAVIAPELMVGFAARQLWAARRFSKGRQCSFRVEFDVSITHGFFISMGGFVSQNGHAIITIKQLQNPEYISAIRKVKAEYIMDKSKGDALSKGVALTQGLWFIMKCLARVHQHLPVTQIEVATLAFAVVNVLIWSLWWAKPLDVGQPISAGSAAELDETQPTIPPLRLVNKFSGVFNGDYSPYLPIKSTSVPSFWAMDCGEGNKTQKEMPFHIECLIGTIFGAIHCAAWNANFPSAIEMWMWRSCSVMVAIIPVFPALVMALSMSKDMIPNTLAVILLSIHGVSLVFYPIARLFLITIPFTSLRALPPGALIDVDWSVYIPHL
ncbi:hypothetical protein C8R44DRAFT_755073 [Mycena epipterygia]|nr:hypothetical protein C8R44DRAFT_755073 [Mycena epipterygia]